MPREAVSAAPMDAPYPDSRAGIRDMFSRVAGRYDLLNRLLSAGRDSAWRRKAARELAPLPEAPRVLDLCAGTLDFALAAREAFPGAKCAGADFCLPMLALGKRKSGAENVAALGADAMRLPFRDESFDAAVCGFGIRNLPSPPRGLDEIFRVLRPGGKVCILEFFQPDAAASKLFYATYARAVIPVVGGLVSGDWEAYRYLPSSVRTFYTMAEFEDLMRETGFTNVRSAPLTLGVAAMVAGEKGEIK